MHQVSLQNSETTTYLLTHGRNEVAGESAYRGDRPFCVVPTAKAELIPALGRHRRISHNFDYLENVCLRKSRSRSIWWGKLTPTYRPFSSQVLPSIDCGPYNDEVLASIFGTRRFKCDTGHIIDVFVCRKLVTAKRHSKCDYIEA